MVIQYSAEEMQTLLTKLLGEDAVRGKLFVVNDSVEAWVTKILEQMKQGSSMLVVLYHAVNSEGQSVCDVWISKDGKCMVLTLDRWMNAQEFKGFMQRKATIAAGFPPNFFKKFDQVCLSKDSVGAPSIADYVYRCIRDGELLEVAAANANFLSQQRLAWVSLVLDSANSEEHQRRVAMLSEDHFRRYVCYQKLLRVLSDPRSVKVEFPFRIIFYLLKKLTLNHMPTKQLEEHYRYAILTRRILGPSYTFRDLLCIMAFDSNFFRVVRKLRARQYTELEQELTQKNPDQLRALRAKTPETHSLFGFVMSKLPQFLIEMPGVFPLGCLLDLLGLVLNQVSASSGLSALILNAFALYYQYQIGLSGILRQGFFGLTMVLLIQGMRQEAVDLNAARMRGVREIKGLVVKFFCLMAALSLLAVRVFGEKRNGAMATSVTAGLMVPFLVLDTVLPVLVRNDLVREQVLKSISLLMLYFGLTFIVDNLVPYSRVQDWLCSMGCDKVSNPEDCSCAFDVRSSYLWSPVSFKVTTPTEMRHCETTSWLGSLPADPGLVCQRTTVEYRAV